MAFTFYNLYSHFVDILVSQTSVWKIYLSIAIIGLIRVIMIFWKYARRRAEYSKLLPGNEYPWYDFMGDFRELFSSDLLKTGKSLHSVSLQMHLNNIIKFEKKKIMCYWASYVPVVLIWNAEAAEVVLQDKEIEGISIIHKYIEPLLCTGLLTSDYNKWKNRRKLIAPCFNDIVLKTFMPIFNEQAQILVKILGGNEKREFIRISLPITLCVMEVHLQTILGLNLEVQENSDVQYVRAIRSLGKLLYRRSTHFWPDLIFSRTKQGKEVYAHFKYMKQFARTLIKEKKANFLIHKFENNDTKRKAILDYLLEQHLQTKELSEEDVIEEVETFLIAGQATTANALCWALYSIGLHKDIQGKIHSELGRVFGDDVKKTVDLEDLKNLKYLDCVLKEVKRMYPPIPVIAKRTSEELNVCGYKVPNGTTCCVLAYAVHRDEREYPNPEEFNPDRFLPENSSNRHPFAYIPFSVGPRNCIGSKFSKMEEMVVISTILRHFKIESVDQRDQAPILDVTLKPGYPIQVKFTPRNE